MDFAIATPPSTPSPTKPRRQLIDTLSPFKYVSPTKSSRSSTPYKQSQKNFCPPNSGLDDDELPRVICQPEAGSSTQAVQCVGSSNRSHMGGTPSCSPKRKRTRIEEDTLPLTPRTPKKRKKPRRPYAPPETYEHLYYLQDLLELYQKVVFCGINPGCQSGKTGLHYAHATNHFWQCLHLSGLTERQLAPEEAHLLPEVYEFGLTNLVDRPTAESELSKAEMNEGVPLLMDKLIKYRPRTLCFLGKGIWDVFRTQAFKSVSKPTTRRPSPRKKSSTPKGADSSEASSIWVSSPRPKDPVSSKYFNTESNYTVPSSPPSPLPEQRVGPPEARVKPHSTKPSFKWGLQPFKLVYPKKVNGRSFPVHETLIFFLPSPSARVVAYQWWDKAELFKELKVHLDAMEEDDTSCDTARFAVIPLISTKSVYFL
ncbi:uracil-DNA glycosylase-like protein [Irpex lacteus]|nr:uracil-DNA glycosylase-like protein [Irpex lacteus]